MSLTGDSLLPITQPAINVFLASKQDNGLIAGITYWQVANGYTAIALHDTWSNTTSDFDILDDLTSKVEDDQKDFVNEMNDDSMWWSICMLEMFDLGRKPQHLQIARNIRDHVNHYVIPHGKYVINGTDMEGGVMWSSKANETQVNSITTGLFSELSARLAGLQDEAKAKQSLLASAVNSFSWILRCRFVQDEYLVLDHINLDSGETVDWEFTYNTGQAIGASIAIYSALKASGIEIDHYPTPEFYLDLACNMASNAMVRSNWVNKNGTLTEPGAYPGTGENKKQAWQNDDAVGFKAILLRNLAKLYKVLRRDKIRPKMQTNLAKFIEWQFQSLQEHDTNGKGQYGPWWAGPLDLFTSHSQLAALDVMAAIHAV